MANNVTEGLTSKQANAIAALMQAPTVEEAASVAKVGKRTLYRWMKEPDFRRALQAAEDAAIDAATRRLVTLQGQAIDALEGVLSDPLASDTVKLRAATSVLEFLLKLRELRNFERRISALESAILEGNGERREKLENSRTHFVDEK